MRLLQEMKGIRFTLDQTLYYGFQQYIRSAESPSSGSSSSGQPTLHEVFQANQRSHAANTPRQAHAPVELMTREVRKLHLVIFLTKNPVPCILALFLAKF